MSEPFDAFVFLSLSTSQPSVELHARIFFEEQLFTLEECVISFTYSLCTLSKQAPSTVYCLSKVNREREHSIVQIVYRKERVFAEDAFKHSITSVTFRYPYRVGRASGHNIMRFGRSSPMQENNGLSESEQNNLLASLLSLGIAKDTSALMDENDGTSAPTAPFALYVTNPFVLTDGFYSPVGRRKKSFSRAYSGASLKDTSTSSPASSSSSSPASADSSPLPVSFPDESSRTDESLNKSKRVPNRFLLPHLFLSSLTPSLNPSPSRVSGYPFNKKADLRDRNNFIHFG